MFRDIDSDGRQLFSELHTRQTAHGFVQYGTTAFGFDENGEISDRVHYKIIRMLHFSPDHPAEGQLLLQWAMDELGSGERIFAFFHYFGMSVCARHGKLHESDSHVEKLLLENGFNVEHENVYYSKELTGQLTPSQPILLRWREKSAGDCREFAATYNGREIGWGQIHFLPQGDIAYLRWIYIDEAQQRKGFGTAIMETLFQALHTMGIHRFDTDTALQNTAAQRYYEKTGFTNRGITRSYYTKYELAALLCGSQIFYLTYLDYLCILCLDDLCIRRYSMKVEKSLLTGTTPLLVLSLLRDSDKYGYEMIEELAMRSDDTFQLKEGTLYPLLHALEKENLIRSYTKVAPSGRERKYYTLTENGRGQLEYKKQEWKLFSEKVNAVIGCANA